MQRRIFLKSLVSTLAGAAALPFVKLPRETKKDYETTTHTTEGAHVHQVDVYYPRNHTHAMGTLLPSNHTHSLSFPQPDPHAHTHSVNPPFDPNGPLTIDKNSWE